MSKPLAEMTKEQLWALFPIILKAYDSAYPDWYEEQSARVRKAVPPAHLYRLSHIGSTSVPGLAAKPTVDMLLELRSGTPLPKIRQALEADGWLLMSCQEEPHLWLRFNKGYTPDGYAKKVYHLHVRFAGDWGELYFRDYLRTHADAAEGYACLKRMLCKKFEHDRDAYTGAKTDFILQYTHLARAAFPGRYTPLE